MLLLRCIDDGVLYIKIGYINKGSVPSRMNYSSYPNVPLTTYFELVDYYQWDTPRAKEIEDNIHHNIRNVWKWKCDGKMGIYHKHKYFSKLFSGVTECRVFNKEEVAIIINCVEEELQERIVYENSP